MPGADRERAGRLALVKLDRFLVDEARVEAALSDHLAALGLPRLPIRWAAHPEAGFREAWQSFRWQEICGGKGAAKHRAWRRRASSWRKRSGDFVAMDARRAAEMTAGCAPLRRLLTMFWERAKANGHCLRPSGTADVMTVLAAVSDRGLQVWEPFLAAWEGGCWIFWVTRAEIIAVPRPAVKIEAGQLHAVDGPAVYWPDGPRLFFLYGVQVPKWLVVTPAGNLDHVALLREQDAGVRRELARKIGIERLMQRFAGGCVDKERGYELILLDLGDGRRRPYLKMTCPSNKATLFEGVPPETRSVREALAWRNGLFGWPDALT